MRQRAMIPGSPLMPNCTMKPEITRKKRDVVVETVLHQIVEAVGALRRPGARHLDHEHALGGVEPRLVGRRRLLAQAPRDWPAPIAPKAGAANSASVKASEIAIEPAGDHCAPRCRRRAQSAREFLLQARDNRCRHEGRNVAAHAGDLPHQSGGDRADRRRGRQEYRLHSGAIAPFMPAICIS